MASVVMSAFWEGFMQGLRDFHSIVTFKWRRLALRRGG
jgi:hypothetical protein